MKFEILLTIGTVLLSFGLPMFVVGGLVSGDLVYSVSGFILTALGLAVDALWVFRRKAQPS